MELSSPCATTARRIDGGIFGNGAEMTPDMTPLKAGLAQFLDMDKGDFIGRNARLGNDTRSCLLGLACRTGT
jgi:aminomethyltransferase